MKPISDAWRMAELQGRFADGSATDGDYDEFRSLCGDAIFQVPTISTWSPTS